MAEPKKKQQQKKQQKKKGGKAQLLGITATKDGDFSEWYTQIVLRAELIEYSDISGCYILRPWAFALWEKIQGYFDSRIKKMGVKNAYFPIFVSERALTKEKDHIEGFAAEVAWVTKSGQSELKEPIAVRPTSETVMYPIYAKWIRSHRDLPLKLNQWCNVVRWEFKHPIPFLRSREFLWQEGHSAFAKKAEAEEEVMAILNLYSQLYHELLAVPVIKGKKSEKEKFAGGLYTTTVEAFVAQTGRSIQAATSHCLGQNFAKMFNISFESEEKKKELPWQNSWGLSTRAIGTAVMIHGDDNGLVLPPRAAEIQVAFVPIYKKANKEALNTKMHELAAVLNAVGIRTYVDDRENYNPGWKYSHWETKGVPLRVELGSRDMGKSSAMAVRRDKARGEEGQKTVISWEGFADSVQKLLDAVHDSLLQKALEVRNAHIKKATTWDEFMVHLNSGNMVLVPWCGTVESENEVKKRSAESTVTATDAKFELTGAAKSLCIPFAGQPGLDLPELTEETVCFVTGGKATCWALFGRSY